MKLNEQEKDIILGGTQSMQGCILTQCRLRIKGRIFDSLDNSQQRGPYFLRPGSGLRVNWPEVVAPNERSVGEVVRVAAIGTVEGFEPATGGCQVPIAESHLPLTHQVGGVALAPQVFREDFGFAWERVVAPPGTKGDDCKLLRQTVPRKTYFVKGTEEIKQNTSDQRCWPLLILYRMCRTRVLFIIYFL